MILEDVQTVLAGAFDGHAGTDDLGEAVDIEGLNATEAFDAAAHGARPRLGPEDAHPQRQCAHIDAQLSGALGHVQKVTGGAADGRDAEVAHDHDLAVGVAAGDGNHRRAQPFGPVMRAQAAGEQPVAVSVLNDVAVVQAADGEAAHHHGGPHIDVLLRVGHHDRLAGGAAGGVQAHDLLHRAGEQAEGVGVAQIGLDGERQPRDIVERAHVIGPQMVLVHPRPVQRNALPGAGDDAPEAAQLQLAQQLRRHEVGRADRVEGRAGNGLRRNHAALPLGRAAVLDHAVASRPGIRASPHAAGPAGLGSRRRGIVVVANFRPSAPLLRLRE